MGLLYYRYISVYSVWLGLVSSTNYSNYGLKSSEHKIKYLLDLYVLLVLPTSVKIKLKYKYIQSCENIFPLHLK